MRWAAVALTRRYLLPRGSRAMLLVFLLLGLLGVACDEETFTLHASGPFGYLAEYPAATNPPQERVAILVTITSRSSDDLQVNPADFVARDSDHRIYPANVAAIATDSRQVKRLIGALGIRDVSPLPSITLRKDDVLSGFVVFDVPPGVRPVDLIWRQVDGDSVANLSSTP